jgi:hypothetical protein
MKPWRYLKLTNTHLRAKVDARDYARVSKLKWLLNNGYATATKDVHIHLSHFILRLPNSTQIDHRFHNKLDNRRSRLRPCTPSQNSCNQKPRKRPTSSSQFKGVDRVRSRFTARIRLNYQYHYIGAFDDEIAAAEAYDFMALKLHGEFAFLNFPRKRRFYRTSYNLPPQLDQITLICQSCSNEFTPAHPLQRICTPRCARIHYSNLRRRNHPPRTYASRNCAYCSRPFVPARSSQKFCTPRCAITFHSHQRPSTAQSRNCACCDRAFLARNLNHRFCDRPLCLAAYRARRLARRRAARRRRAS